MTQAGVSGVASISARTASAPILHPWRWNNNRQLSGPRNCTANFYYKVYGKFMIYDIYNRESLADKSFSTTKISCIFINLKHENKILLSLNLKCHSNKLSKN